MPPQFIVFSDPPIMQYTVGAYKGVLSLVLQAVKPSGLTGRQADTIASALKRQIACSSEILVSTYRATWRHNPEGQLRHTHRRGNIKPHKKVLRQNTLHLTCLFKGHHRYRPNVRSPENVIK
jgi:hypothetical protein